MRLLVTIDLSRADVALFESYEARVLPLLARYGGRLDMRVRALDGGSETHLLHFPDADAFARYEQDADRLAARGDLDRSGAIARVQAVETIAV